MAKKPKSRKRSHGKLWLSYTRDDEKAWMVLTREADSVWLDAHGSLVFNAQQCRTLAEWLNERADEMEAK